ncbi:MAG: polysaccharide deacetylase family protein [Firmicutes bacterium]|nr:polysaccharide deacetylase family protein [Bacillota bacterium]
MEKGITVVFGFDVETDLGSWTPFYDGVEKGTPKLLELLGDADVKATFFFTGEAASKFPALVREIDSRGHEVGCHSLYHETIGDELFPIPGVKPLLPEEVPLRVKRATELVEAAVGKEVLSFRCPRLWGSTAVVNALEDLGFLADASYPLYYYRERLIPYHPSRNDWTKEGDMRLLEIPNFADMSMESRDEFGRDRDQWPLFRTDGADKLMIHVRNYISYLKERSLPVVLCFYMHPWEFVEMPGGLIHYGEGSVMPDEFITRNCGDKALMELGNLIRDLKEEGAGFMTTSELARAWK